jgi:hypothetical protein
MIKSKIEIAERSTEKLTYEEAVMYCFCLGDGWRLPSEEEYQSRDDEYERLHLCWFENDPIRLNNTKWYVCPVRDLKDD